MRRRAIALAMLLAGCTQSGEACQLGVDDAGCTQSGEACQLGVDDSRGCLGCNPVTDVTCFQFCVAPGVWGACRDCTMCGSDSGPPGDAGTDAAP